MSSSPYRIPVAVDFSQMKRSAKGTVDWIWQGYVAFGSITLFTSRWKSGKTTLLSVLLSRLKQGGTLADSPVHAAAAVVVSEESPAIWVARGEKLSFGSHLKWFCQPFFHSPSSGEWYDLVCRIGDLSVKRPTMIVIDPLVAVLPGSVENNAAAIMKSLGLFRILTQKGAAVLLLHHPSKGRSLDPRGSGALASFADILMELDLPHNAAPNDRRRWLRARGRHDVAPRERLIELVADGNDYVVRHPEAEDCANGLQIICMILSDARSKQTRQQICADWPETLDKPHKGTLCKWLQQAVDQGLIRCDGQGRRYSPYRYWLPEREELFGRELEPLEEIG